jgi:glutamyl endopeptidase
MFRSLLRRAPARKTTPRTRTTLGLTTLEDREMPAGIGSLVTNTTAYPNRAAMQVLSIWDVNRNGVRDNGDVVSQGSAAMVSSHQALTAGHVIYDNDPSTPWSGFATWVMVTPGKNGSSAPYGTVWARRLTVPTSWAQGNYLSDIGVIHLNRNIGNTVGWYGYGNVGSALQPGVTLRMSHYPGSEGFNGTRQYLAVGAIAGANANVIAYRETQIRSVGGSSGAPLYARQVTINGRVYNNMILGVNVRSDTGLNGFAQSTRINSTWFNFIRNTLQGTPPPAGSWATNGPTRAIGSMADTPAPAGGAYAVGLTDAASDMTPHGVSIAPPVKAADPGPPVTTRLAPRAADRTEAPAAATMTPPRTGETGNVETKARTVSDAVTADYAEDGLGLFAAVSL